MKLKVWGARGSVPAPGPHMNRYGGNTSCVQPTLASGEELILDAGTGIRTLGLDLNGGRRINILLTHLHLDHIQGLMFFPPCFRPESKITIWGPVVARGLAGGPDRPLHLRPALAGRGPRAALLGRVPRHAGDRVGARRRDDPRRGGHPPRPDARLPDHRRRHDGRLHPRPRAGARRAARRARAGVDLRLRPRPRRRPADPRLPVHRRGVPRPRRLGALGRRRHAHLRQAGRGPPAAALPPRPPAFRRVPRRLLRRRARRLGGPRPRRHRARDGHGGRRARGRGRAPPARPDGPFRAYKRSGPKFRHSDNEASAARAYRPTRNR